MKKISLFILLLLLTTSEGRACTLWAYCNTIAEGREIYIGKVRDTVLNHSEEVRFVHNPGELSYSGIFAIGADNEYTYNPLKAGTNEKGLTVIFSSIGTIPPSIRFPLSEKDPLHTVLSRYSSVEEAIKNPSIFGNPKIVLLADKNEIAKIEIGLDGKVSIRRTKSGFLVATNHYVELSEQNLQAIETSSIERLRAVEKILNDSLASDTDTNSKIIQAVTRRSGKVQTTSVWTSKISFDGKPSIDYIPVVSPSCTKLFL